MRATEEATEELESPEEAELTEEVERDSSGAVLVGEKRLQGICAGCGGGIPFGYLAHVSKWKSISLGHGVKRQVPEKMWCKNCAGHAGNGQSNGHAKPKPKPDVTPAAETAQPIKEIAEKIWKQMSKDKPHSIRWLAKRAKVGDVDKAVLRNIFRKMQEAGKIELIDGMWVKK